MKIIVLTILTIFLSMSAALGQDRQKQRNLLVFVGEKIDVIYSPEEKKPVVRNDSGFVIEASISLDYRYIARYKILQMVHGTHKTDTIEFTVFDHYGEPAFSRHQTVLLFVSYHEGKLYHEKYQYFDLYMTQTGQWASPYASGDYNHTYKKNITVKPEKIPFTDEVSFPIGEMTERAIEIWFPQPFYEIKNGRAIAIYGNYVADLFKLKQQTILKARGIY